MELFQKVLPISNRHTPLALWKPRRTWHGLCKIAEGFSVSEEAELYSSVVRFFVNYKICPNQ